MTSCRADLIPEGRRGPYAVKVAVDLLTPIILIVDSQSFTSALSGLGVPNTGSRSWPSVQSFGGYWCVADLTDPVAALLQSNRGGLNAGQMRVRTLNERRQLRPFVGDRLTLGIVLVVAIGVHRCGEEGLEIRRHARQSGADLLPCTAQALGGGLKIDVRPDGARSTIRRRCVMRQSHLRSILQEATRPWPRRPEWAPWPGVGHAASRKATASFQWSRIARITASSICWPQVSLLGQPMSPPTVRSKSMRQSPALEL